MTAKQPPTYSARYCDSAIDCLSLGHTLAAFAAETGVPRATLLAWAKAHPDFANALRVGQAKAVTFWERMLADIARSGKGNATAAIFALKNCAAEDSAQASDADKAIQDEAQSWSDLELARRIAHILMLADRSEEEGNAHDAAIA
jgi:hypothetical protein